MILPVTGGRDRPTLYSWLAAPQARWLAAAYGKRAAGSGIFCISGLPYDLTEKHTISTHLSLLKPLGVPAIAEVYGELAQCRRTAHCENARTVAGKTLRRAASLSEIQL
jgi:hypothetical protein